MRKWKPTLNSPYCAMVTGGTDLLHAHIAISETGCRFTLSLFDNKCSIELATYIAVASNAKGKSLHIHCIYVHELVKV